MTEQQASELIASEVVLKLPERSGTIVVRCVLATIRPMIRWLIRHGVTFPEFADRAKRIFLEEAKAELLASRPKPPTDSALSLLSGVHRRDIREFRAIDALGGMKPSPIESFGVASQVFARWVTDPNYLDQHGEPLTLERQNSKSFDHLVLLVSADVSPKSVLEQLHRLGIVRIDADDLIHCEANSFVPRAGLAQMGHDISMTLRDHIQSCIDNVEGRANWLEQCIYVDSISSESAHILHTAAAKIWRQNHQDLMRLAQERFEIDQASATDTSQRARLGMFYFNERQT